MVEEEEVGEHWGHCVAAECDQMMVAEGEVGVHQVGAEFDRTCELTASTHCQGAV